jgi:polysaccharide pyruvyl transferase WcaK-like protein
MKPKKIVIVNDGLGPNKGDQAILLSMMDSLRGAIPEAQIRAFPNSKMCRVSQYFEFWRALKKADLFIFGGGQEIQDHASVAFLISGLLKIILAKILSRPIFCYAVGVGPVATGLGKLFTRLVLNQVDLITVRDEDSRECLKGLRVTKPPCFVTADPTLALTPVDGRQVRNIFSSEGITETNGPRVAIIPRRWFHYQHYLLPMTFRAKFRPLRGRKEYAHLKKIIAQVADYLVAVHKAQVVFVPMRSAGSKVDPGQDDDQVSKEIINLMKYREDVFLLRGDYSPKELKAFLGQMDLVVGMRMHSLVFASMMNVPVIGLALSPKFASFFKLIGQSEFLISLENINYGNLLEKTNTVLSKREKIREELKLRKKALQELALSNTGYVQEILRNRG